MATTVERSQHEPPAPLRGLTMLWRSRPSLAAPPESPQPLISRILAARDLHDSAREFLEPSLKQLHDPSLIPDLDRAAQRLLDAITRAEPITIYGDYDVDGITASAILFHTIRALRPDAPVSTYVPHRLDEGYGINSEAIREIARTGARVVVSVDCGITAVEPARVARELALDLIITDHHTPPATLADLPDAYAVVHPRRPDSTYPFGDLCGAGVAFKLAWRLATLSCGASRVSDSLRTLLLELLSLTALGVIADVVPLLGENRVIARFGLSKIKSSAFPGLRALVEASGLAGENVDSMDVGFKLAPRLNACGRMGHAREAVELLTVAAPTRARAIADELTRLNNARRATEQGILEEAQQLAVKAGMTDPARRAIVLAHPDWHAGVVGIVCSRLVERFHRPVILLCEKDGVCHGSGRSIDGFNLHAAIEQCAGHVLQFGGHDMAAGMKIASDRLESFTHAFTEVCNSAIAESDLIGRAAYDCDASLAELSVPVVRELDRLGPFGRCNPRVRLRFTGLRLAGRSSTFGAMNKHLSMFVASAAPGGPTMRAFGWNWAHAAGKVSPGAPIELLATPAISTYGGIKVELEISDIRVVE